MKFLVTKELEKSIFLKYLMGSLVLFVVVFLVTDVIFHHYFIGLTVDQATTTLFGNEETFAEPILFNALLLQVHIDFFFSMFILLILAVIYIRLYVRDQSTYIWIHILFISGFMSPLLLLLNYFLSYSIGVLVWIIVFYIWHIVALILCVKIIWKLYFK